MVIQDTPIEESTLTLEDTPIPPATKTSNSSADTEAFEVTQTSFLDSYVTGNSVLDNYNYYSGVADKAQELRRVSTEKAAADVKELEESFLGNPYGETNSIQETATFVTDSILEVKKQAADPDRQYVESIVGDTVDFEEVENQTARAKMYKIVSDAQEDLGIGDIAADFAISVIPFWQSTRGAKLTGAYLGQQDVIRQGVARFRNLPEDEQAAAFPFLKKHLEDTVGKVNAVNILTNTLRPMGAENRQGFSDLEKVFDVIDVAGILGPIAWSLRSLKSSYNTVKTAKALGNDTLAVDTNIAAIVDPELARAASLSQDTATANALPFDVSLENPAYTSGLSGKHIEELRENFGEVDKLAEDIITGKGFLKEGILNTVERADVEEATFARLRSEKAENITIADRNENVTTFSYNVLDEDGAVSKTSFDLKLTLNDAGMWDQDTMSLISRMIASPTVQARGLLRLDVDTAGRIDYLNSKLNKQLLDATREALRPIGLLPTPGNKASLAKVDDVLLQGDEFKNADGTRGKVYSVEELRAQYSLEDNEISAYYRINRLNNNLHRIRNHEARQEHIARGYQQVTFTRNSESMSGKVFESANDASLSMNSRNTNFVYDAELDVNVGIKGKQDNFFSNIYDNNKKIVRLSTPYDIGGGRGKVNFAIVSADEIAELPAQVLSRKVGYVPRVYEGNSYFVKEVYEELVDGDKTVTNKKTLRFFDNKKEADEYTAGLVAKAMDEQGLTSKAATAKYKVLSDREEEILSASTGDVGGGSGGLYTGARSQDDILFGLNGDKPNRLNSFESLTRNIGNLSKYTSINQWRMGLEQRWINTANRIFEQKGVNVKVQGFDRLATTSEASEEVAFLNKMHDQIRDWQGFASTEERLWAATTTKLYESAANKGMKRTQKMLGSLRDKDPIGIARSTAFHSLLGWFNPSQLWVQAQGSMMAASLSVGKYLTKTVGQSTALQMLDVGREGVRGAAKLIGKAAGMSEQELLRMHELWKKTGYFDSIKQTADHAAASKGYGMSVDLFKRTSDAGLIFYRGGELINRRMSFTTAINRWSEKNAGKGIMDIDDIALKSIMDDANNMMMNMTRSNRASFQKGVFSLPTQFLQVTTKFLETAGGFNRNFTLAERQKMIAAQFIMYGTAGVPLIGLGNKMLLGMGITQKEIDDNPGLVKTWNDGVWGAATFWLLGADIEVSSRGSLLRGVGDFMDNWFVQESNIAEKMLGAFGSTGTRFWDSAMHRIKPFTLGNMSTIRWEDGAKLITMPFIDMVSTKNNIVKAEYMERLNASYSKSGRKNDTYDYNFMEELAVRLGFQTTRDSESYTIVQYSKAGKKLQTLVQEYSLRELNSFAFKYPDGGYTDKEYQEHAERLQVALGSLYPDEAIEVYEAIQKEILSDGRRSMAVSRAYDNIKTNLTSDASTLKALLLGNGIIRVGNPTEDTE
jgi:hypothetical protein